MKQCPTKIMLTSVALLTFTNAQSLPAPKEKKAESKHIPLEISRSTVNQLHEYVFKQPVKNTIRELTEHVATIENNSRVFGSTSASAERKHIADLQQYRKNQKLHVTAQAISSNGTKELINHFVMTDHAAKVPLTVPAVIPGKHRNEKTQSVLISIAPIANLEEARKHNLVREHEYPFKKLYNNTALHFSPTDHAAKKYKPKSV